MHADTAAALQVLVKPVQKLAAWLVHDAVPQLQGSVELAVDPSVLAQAPSTPVAEQLLEAAVQ